jgi:hypothetical protein
MLDSRCTFRNQISAPPLFRQSSAPRRSSAAVDRRKAAPLSSIDELEAPSGNHSGATGSQRPTLYHGRTSVCSVKVRLALAEKGAPFESRLLALRGDPFDPEYMKLSPNAVVPTLLHDGCVIIESTVIMHYVDEAFAGTPLMPANPLDRANGRMITKLVDEHVHMSCMALDPRDREPRSFSAHGPRRHGGGACTRARPAAIGHQARGGPPRA